MYIFSVVATTWESYPGAEVAATEWSASVRWLVTPVTVRPHGQRRSYRRICDCQVFELRSKLWAVSTEVPGSNSDFLLVACMY